MAPPDRTDRRLHWHIELFKVSWGSLVLLIGGLVALSRGLTWADRFTREGILMFFGVVVGVLMLAAALGLAWIVFMSIRKLPNE